MIDPSYLFHGNRLFHMLIKLRTFKAAIFFFASLFLLLSAGCKSLPVSETTAPQPELSDAEITQAQQQADKLFKDFYQYQLDSSPVLRSVVGMNGQFEWDDLSNDAYESYLTKLQFFRQALLAIEVRALSEEKQLSYELLLKDIEESLVFAPFRHHSYRLSQMGGWHTRVPNILINYQNITSIQDAHDYINRIKAVRHLFKELITQLKQAEEAGIAPPRFIYAPVISASLNVIKGAPFDSGNDSPIWKDFNSKLERLALYESSNKVLKKKARRALTRYLKPAYKELIAFLQEQQHKAPLHQSLSDLPNGAEYYNLLLSSHTTTDMNADQIHQIGLTEVARIQGEIRHLIAPLKYPEASEPEFDANKTDLKFFFQWMEDTSERFSIDEQGKKDFVAFQRDKVSAMSMRLNRAFSDLPKSSIVVRPVEEYRQSSAPIAFYEQPALDGSRPGFYYVNPARQADLPKYRLAALAYHEALPGHHLQVALARENTNLEEFRRLMGFTAFSEGWALYAEKLAGELGGYTSNEERYGQLIMELWRAVRLVLDTGLHAKGWSKEQALQYRLDNTPFSEEDSLKAIERYLVMPGQATSYKIGAREIEHLRARAEQTLGKNFSLAEFHTALLKNAALPLDILEQQVNNWLKGK